MREIEFRGKRKDGGGWVFGFYSHNLGKSVILGNAEPNSGWFREYEVIPETVGQFIGLHDGNGKKIFEADILEYYLKDEDDGVGFVFYKYDRFVISSNRPSGVVEIGSCGDWKIIGNVYDSVTSLTYRV